MTWREEIKKWWLSDGVRVRIIGDYGLYIRTIPFSERNLKKKWCRPGVMVRKAGSNVRETHVYRHLLLLTRAESQICKWHREEASFKFVGLDGPLNFFLNFFFHHYRMIAKILRELWKSCTFIKKETAFIVFSSCEIMSNKDYAFLCQ